MNTPLPYPFPILGIMDYPIPVSAQKAKQKIIWDRDIKFVGPKVRNQPSGIYIWHENHHGLNKVIYVGCSEQLYTRLSQHCHCSKDVSETSSPVFQYMHKRPDDVFTPCDKYPLGCDCIPRFFVRIFSFSSCN